MQGVRVGSEREMTETGTPVREMYFSRIRHRRAVRIRLWDPENQRLVWSNDVILNEDTICTDKVQTKSGKRVNFDLTPSNLEEYADESQGSMENLFRTIPEDYQEVTAPDDNLPVTSLIPVSHGSTSAHGLDTRE
jgi:hypothetical protein